MKAVRRLGQRMVAAAATTLLLAGALVSAPTAYADEAKYDRAAAVQWALDNVETPERVKGRDCTWFVSNALWAGGLPGSFEWHSLPGINGVPPRNTVAADYLKNYLVNEKLYATITELTWDQNDVPEAELGDIIMYDWNSDGVVDHAMIITDFSGQYPKVSGHSVRALNQGWTYSDYSDKWIQEANPSSRVYLIHITY